MTEPYGKQQPGTRPILALAAESIAARTGRAETIVDVIHARAFRLYAEAVRQYLAFRLGSVVRAEHALEETRIVVAATPATELIAAPGVRARVFRMAREVAARRLAASGSPEPSALDALPLRHPPTFAGLPLRAQLAEVIDRSDLELLELRLARELTSDEVTYVVDRPAAEVNARLLRAGVVGRERLAGEDDFEAAVTRAFALVAADPATCEAHPQGAVLESGTVLGGRYRIDGRVGSGAFSDVFRALDTEVPGHVVAVKWLHQPALSDSARDTALRELRLIASVFHPSVVQFKDHGWHEHRLWFVMPWYEGETLESRIRRAPLERREARRIFETLARALGTMHAAGVRHQDIKPDNIFLARLRGDGEVLPVLLDLGVAATEAEMVVAGTPTYFAPEVAAKFASVGGEHAVGPPADVFALTLALRNSLEPSTQEEVTGGAVETFIERRARIVPCAPEAPDLAFLQASFARWLSPDPTLRPSADQLAQELAILTRPEERRARLVATLKWATPLVIALALGFGSVVHNLSERITAFRTRATHAETAVVDMRDRLNEVDVERSQLATTLARSELTRDELATRLASTLDDLGESRQGLGQEQRRARALEERVARVEADLVRTSDSRLAAETALAEATESLRQQRRELELARAETTQLDLTVAMLRSEVATERARGEVLNGRLAQAELARATALRDLQEAERRLDEAHRARRPETQPSPEPGAGDGTLEAPDDPPPERAEPDPHQFRPEPPPTV